MEKRISKWGNSLILRFGVREIKRMNLEMGDVIEFTIQNVRKGKNDK